MTDPKQLSPAEVQSWARRTIAQLNNAIRTLRIHEPSHPSVTAIVDPLATSLNSLAAHFGKTLTIELASDVVLFNEVRFRVTATSAAQVEVFRAELEGRRIGGLAFQPPVRADALRTYLHVFAKKPESPEERDRLTRSLVALGRDHGIRLLDPRTFVDEEDAELIRTSQRTFALEAYARLIVAFEVFVSALEDGEDPLEGRLHIVQLVQHLIDVSVDRVDHLLSIPLLRRAAGSAFDRAAPRYASVHAANMCVWAVLIGRVLGMERVALLDLGISALLGDLGFAVLPEAMTEREMELSAEERELVRAAMTRASGALLGAGRVNESMKRHLIVAHEHHNPYVDPATGRPAHLHVLSRITAVACAFDAMTSPRPWRQAMTQKKAMSILRGSSGGKFDPVVVEALGSLLSTYAGFATFAAPGDP